MKCRSCNFFLPPQAYFCPQCGNPLRKGPFPYPSMPSVHTKTVRRAASKGLFTLASQTPLSKHVAQTLSAHDGNTPVHVPLKSHSPAKRWGAMLGVFLITIAGTLWIKSSLTNSQTILSTFLSIVFGVLGLMTSFIQALDIVLPGDSWFQAPPWFTALSKKSAVVKMIDGGIPTIGSLGIILALVIPTPSVTPPTALQILMEKVETLTPGVDIGVYQSTLGGPTLIHDFRSLDGKKGKEYVFVSPYFYLQAITGSENQVQFFAITGRSKVFTPTFTTRDFTIILGVSTFETRAFPGTIRCSLGVMNYFYYETLATSGISFNQVYGFGLNDVGYRSADLDLSGLYQGEAICDRQPMTGRGNMRSSTHDRERQYAIVNP